MKLEFHRDDSFLVEIWPKCYTEYTYTKKIIINSNLTRQPIFFLANYRISVIPERAERHKMLGTW